MNIKGKIVKVKEITNDGLIVELDNGVIITISCSPQEIHMHFSGIKYNGGIVVKEAVVQQKSKSPLELPNYITIQYKPVDGR